MYKYKAGDRIVPNYIGGYPGVIMGHFLEDKMVEILWRGNLQGEKLMQWFIDYYFHVVPVQKVL